ncbi:MAG: glycosyltransferase family 2 protein [Candidatus Heimdallarchaeaceae archaeon]
MKPNKKWAIIGTLLYFFTLSSLILGCFYLTWSIYLNVYPLFVSKITTKLIFQILLNFISLFFETFGIFYTTLLFYHMANSCFHPQLNILETQEHEKRELPEVTVVVPVHNPIIDVLKETLVALKKIDYPKSKVKVIIGDDTLNEELAFKIKSLVEDYNAIYFFSPLNKYFKAGMLNEILQIVKTEYIFFLDYDHTIFPTVLAKCVRILEKDSRIAYVQTKVNFREVKSKLQLWESVMYAQFFEIFSRSKSIRKTTIFNGSSACFRTKILKEIGGIPRYSFTEDVATTVEILKKNYKGVLLDEYGSLGLVPAKFDVLISQIIRWAKGQFSVLRKKWREILRSDLSIFDKIDLLFSISLFLVASILYFSGFVYITMFFSNISLIRPPIEEFLPLLIIPVSFSLSYYLSGILSISFANRSNMNYKYRDLIFFYIFALVFNPFTIYATFKSLISNKEPIRGKNKWNERVPIYSYLVFVTIVGGIMVACSVLDFINNSFGGSFWLGLGILGSSMLFTTPLAIYFMGKTKKNNIYEIN